MRKINDLSTIELPRKSLRPPGIVGRFMNLFASERHEVRHMELVETLLLGGKRQLQLVICDGERFLIGVGGDSIQAMLRVGEDGRESAEQIIR